VFTRLSELADRRPGRVVLTALLVAVLAGAVGGSVAKHLGPYNAEDPASESFKAKERLKHATGLEPTPALVALIETPRGVRSAAAKAKVDRVARTMGSESIVGRVATFYETRDRAMVARDGRATYVTAYFRAQPDTAKGDKRQGDAAKRVDERLSSVPGVTLGGAQMASKETNETVSSDLARAELMAFPLLFLLSFLFFRGVVAAVLPPLVGGLSIVITFLAIRLASEVTSLSVFALNLVTGLGLGLAIDYSLFIVSRYREEIANAESRTEALRRTLATAGRTVLFSSLTVAAALASLLVFPQRFLYSMG
jgi:uncharacterized membrane protein YdfJ with MMPL/SSD domain